MNQGFDPYYKWLGIPPAEQPPHHYRLLGISLFEADPDVIQAAADQRMAHLKGLRLGKHVDLSERLLNEVAAARACLLNPKSKEAYDLKLATEIESSATPVSLPEEFTLPKATVPVPDLPSPKPLHTPRRVPPDRGGTGRALPKLLNWTVGAVLLTIVLVICVVLYDLATQPLPGKLSIVLENAPPGAVVWVDDKKIENLAKSIPLTPGPHDVIIRALDGRILQRQAVVVDAGEPKTIYVRVAASSAED